MDQITALAMEYGQLVFDYLSQTEILVQFALIGLLFLPAWFLLQGYGNHGLWLAFTLFMASRGIGMHIGYQRKVLPAATGL